MAVVTDLVSPTAEGEIEAWPMDAEPDYHWECLAEITLKPAPPRPSSWHPLKASEESTSEIEGETPWVRALRCLCSRLEVQHLEDFPPIPPTATASSSKLDQPSEPDASDDELQVRIRLE